MYVPNTYVTIAGASDTTVEVARTGETGDTVPELQRTEICDTRVAWSSTDRTTSCCALILMHSVPGYLHLLATMRRPAESNLHNFSSF